MREVRGTLSGVVMTVFYVLVCYPAPWQGLSAVVPPKELAADVGCNRNTIICYFLCSYRYNVAVV